MKKKAVKMTTDKTNKEETLESSAPSERIKELASLAFFTLIAAVSSVIIMDIIVFPITLFAVNNKNTYNFIFKYSFLTLVIVLIFYLILNKIYKMKKDGFPSSEIILYLVKKPFSYLGTVLALILISASLLAAVYFILNINYTFLSKIIGS